MTDISKPEHVKCDGCISPNLCASDGCVIETMARKSLPRRDGLQDFLEHEEGLQKGARPLTSKERSLPSWEECDRKAARNLRLTALEKFIHDNEPAPGPGDPSDERFREQLAAVVSEASAPETPRPPSNEVAREWREKELTFVVSALATALDLDGDEQHDALCDMREWAKNRLKARLPDETTVRQPDGYAYVRHWPMRPGETYVAFDRGGEVNGSKPIETIPYWLGPAPPTTFPKRPGECKHELAQLTCADCGIDFPRASVEEPTSTPTAVPEQISSRAGASVGQGASSRSSENGLVKP